MIGLDAIQARIDKLRKRVIPPVRKISVLRQNKDGSVTIPDNVNESGVLLAPPIMTLEEWEQMNIERDRAKLAQLASSEDITRK